MNAKVYVVMFRVGGETEWTSAGVFSTHAKAETFADRLSRDLASIENCVIHEMIIDEPEW